jgi:hypothetical protein
LKQLWDKALAADRIQAGRANHVSPLMHQCAASRSGSPLGAAGSARGSAVRSRCSHCPLAHWEGFGISSQSRERVPRSEQLLRRYSAPVVTATSPCNGSFGASIGECKGM